MQTHDLKPEEWTAQTIYRAPPKHPRLHFFKNCAVSLVKRLVGMNRDLELGMLIQPAFAVGGANLGIVLGFAGGIVAAWGSELLPAIGKVALGTAIGAAGGAALMWGLVGLGTFLRHDLPEHRDMLRSNLEQRRAAPKP